MKTRILHTKFWKDDYVCELSPNEKLIFNYLITNERVNILHFAEISPREISFDTGIDTPAVEIIIKKLTQDSKIKVFKKYIYLVNSEKYETYTGSTNETAKEKILKELSPDALDWYNNLLNTPIDTPIRGVLIPSINHNTEIISHKSENNIDEKDFLNERADEIMSTYSKPVSYSNIDSITSEDIEMIATKYGVAIGFVLSKKEDMELWHGQNPRKNKKSNWKLTLMNWVKRDKEKLLTKQALGRKGSIDATNL